MWQRCARELLYCCCLLLPSPAVYRLWRMARHQVRVYVIICTFISHQLSNKWTMLYGNTHVYYIQIHTHTRCWIIEVCMGSTLFFLCCLGYCRLFYHAQIISEATICLLFASIAGMRHISSCEVKIIYSVRDKCFVLYSRNLDTCTEKIIRVNFRMEGW